MSRNPAPSAALDKYLLALTDRINTLCLTLAGGSAPRLALTIEEAATCIAMSMSQFRRKFIDTGRLKCVPMGDRARAIDYDELRVAYTKYRDEIRSEFSGSAANDDTIDRSRYGTS